MTAMIFQSTKPLFYFGIGQRLNEGGPLFMYTLAAILLVIIALLIKAFAKKESSKKNIELVKSISLFALVWGFLGQIIGLIGAFDTIETFGNVQPEVLATGIKIASLSPAFGMIVFLIGRLGVILLLWKLKE